ncbi:hypothetical protein V3G39_16910 [Dermatophilaceae bacterium Sec6.4]|nr:hypothetical protein [Actinomycetota bacterium]
MSMDTEPQDAAPEDRADHSTDAPAERLMADHDEAGDTGYATDSAASGGKGAPVMRGFSFAEQDAMKHPGDGPNARD